MQTRTLTAIAGLLLAALAAPAAAQSTRGLPAGEETADTSPRGWSVRPSLGFATVRDDNVLFEDEEGRPVAESLNIVEPGVLLRFRGRRGDFGTRYAGSYVVHGDLTSLNSYEQRLDIAGRRALTRRVSFYVRHHAAALPTTELLELLDVPYTRVGSRLQDARAGFTIAASRRTSVDVSYHFQRVDFDSSAGTPGHLTGGYGNGGALSVTRTMTPRTSLTADYSFERAALANGDRFNLQVAWGGVEQKLTTSLRVFGEVGVSHLWVDNTSRVGPAWRAGLARDFRRGAITLAYSRSFVPSYGFGGTTENQDVTARLRLPLGQRVAIETAAAWRSNDPLEVGQLPLSTLWFDTRVGYAVSGWLRVEGFVNGAHQTIDRPGGTLDRFRYGVQVTTFTTARIH